MFSLILRQFPNESKYLFQFLENLRGGRKKVHSMGNLIPCIVFEEVEDEEDDYEISEPDSDISLRTK